MFYESVHSSLLPRYQSVSQSMLLTTLSVDFHAQGTQESNRYRKHALNDVQQRFKVIIRYQKIRIVITLQGKTFGHILYDQT